MYIKEFRNILIFFNQLTPLKFKNTKAGVFYPCPVGIKAQVLLLECKKSCASEARLKPIYIKCGWLF